MGWPVLPRCATPLGVAAVAVAFVGIPAQTSPAADVPTNAHEAAKRCGPLGGLLVKQTIRRALRNGGGEVTERLPHGLYRVTRCDRQGAMTSSMTVAPVRDPDGRSILAPAVIIRAARVLTLDYGDARDPRWAKSWRRVRDRVAASVTPATRGTARPDSAFNRRNATGAVAHAAAKSQCDDGGYLKSGERWPKRAVPWRLNAKSFGSSSDTRESLQLAADAWNLTKDGCDFDDITDLSPEYKGSTDHHAGSQDNVNTVDKGSVKSFGCEGALACTQLWYGPNGVAETDMRFSNQVKWSNSGKSGAYDYRAAATHEFGHSIGLSDLHDSPNLTMYYAIDTGSTGARTLGRGDVIGMRKLYP